MIFSLSKLSFDGIFELLRLYLSYGFVRNALIVSVLVSICAALLGVVLILFMKKYFKRCCK